VITRCAEAEGFHDKSSTAALGLSDPGSTSALTCRSPVAKVHTIVNFGGCTDDLDSVFTALANHHRRQILDLLALQPASIQQLARRIGISLTAIHRHIRVLEDASLIRRKKSGRVNFLALNRATMLRVQEWAQQYHAYWGKKGTDEKVHLPVQGLRHADT
jgi:DNA-binding transcriptional ArsR family regulator